MQCDNCGYIFFQPSKKCACCSAPYAPVQSAFEVGQENLFTIFEMAPGEGGIPGGMGMAGAGAGLDDYNFTDDFGAGGAEYGVDENVLDLSDAEAAGFGAGAAAGSMGMEDFSFDTSDMDNMPGESAESGDFELNLTEEPTGEVEVSSGTVEPGAEADDALDVDFGGGFDEVEGLGFGFDESPAETAEEEPAGEISLEPDSEPEAEISLEPELDVADDQPALELSDEPSLELPEEPALDMDDLDSAEEGPSLELPDDLDLDEEPQLIEPSSEESSELDEEGGIEFDLDSVDLDTPEGEQVTYEVPEAEPDEEPSLEFEDLELEMETPEEPEDEDQKQ